MKVQLLCDNPDSWMVPYAKELCGELKKHHDARYLENSTSVEEGDILVLLSCERIFKKLYLNKFNLVVHESELPKGKGWSPLTWQVLEGKNQIAVTLFEAAESVDSGRIYALEYIDLDGTELIDQLREKQAAATRKLIMDFVNSYPDIGGREQVGEESFYPRRNLKHSQLDINKTIGEQFNLLRVCDNKRYPAWFEINGAKYILRIERMPDTGH